MANAYNQDVVAWAQEQAQLLRSGRFADLDIENIAEEIEDVGKAEQRELASRMGVLLAHLLKWAYKPEWRCSSWKTTLHTQRNRIARRLKKMPSLKGALADSEWWVDVWEEAVDTASKAIGKEYTDFPTACPWSKEELMDHNFLPKKLKINPLQQ